MAACVGRPHYLVNFETQKVITDTLHNKSEEAIACAKHVCNGSRVNFRKATLETRAPPEIISQATQFLEEYYRSQKDFGSPRHKARLQEITDSVTQTGSYDLTFDELEFGAKLAWRNAPRCTGRMTWNQLQLVDARHVKTTKEMIPFMLKHIDDGSNNGNIRSIITVFPHRKKGQRDFRIWNKQYINYAGYELQDGSIIGDKANVEFTKVCQKLGWKGNGGMFDVLPLVVSAPTGPPEIFIIPEDKILRVPLSHPKFEWFKDLKMEWFGLPSVTSMMLDIGGIQFPCAPFNGWYTSPEIGTRNLCDVQRYNLNQFFGEKFGLDTRSPTTLWKDKVALELNIAVLHSFKERGVVIVDQHTVAETFMQFYHNEHRQRGGCPADWVWIVPPISGALTPVFHQEMSVYYLKPSYDYQPEGWVSFQKQNKMLSGEMDQHERFNPVQKFKKIIFAVVFASTLYSAALARRVRIAVLYATETGKAEVFANALTNVLSLNFNPEVICMADYDVSKLSDENLVVVIASTTGSGEPPQNGQEFTKKLFYLREKDIDNSEHNSSAFWDEYTHFVTNAKQDMIITNGEADQKKPSSETVGSYNKMNAKRTSFLIKANGGENEDPDDQGRINKWKLSKPADKIPYVVFALGSRDYENFCAFGKYIHHLLFTSGGNPLLDLTFGDEATNQQEAFNNWTSQLLKVCCDKFQVKNTTSGITSTEKIIRKDQVKFEAHHNPPTLSKTLSKVHGKYVSSCSVLENQTLYENGEKWYQKIIINTNEEKTLQYQPGDHVGVVPANNQSTVSEIISRLDNCPDPDIPVQVYLKLETDDCWFPHPMLSVASIRHLLSRILDIVAVPSPTILRLLANSSSNNIHRSRLNELASNRNEYSHWKKENQFTLLDVLLEFPSVRIDAALLLSRLPLLQPRLYSISSSSDISPNQLCLTVASVSYRTKGGKGTLRKGICTSYLKSLKPGDTIEIFHRSAPGYHLPEDNLAPLILLGSGSGVAPFRGFWQQLQHNSKAGIHVPEVVLYYGCQTRACDLYNEEKTSLCNSRILMRTHLALSRDPVVPKTYVQDLFVNHAKELYEKLVWRKGHIYVCGSEGLATGIYLKLLAIIQDQAKANSDEAHSIIRQMKVERRYHEDIFGSGSTYNQL